MHIKTRAAFIVATIFTIGALSASPVGANVDSHVVGTVIDAATSDPIPGVDVTVSKPGTIVEVVTDANGQYDASGMPAGNYNVRFIDPSEGHMTEYNGGTPTSTGATLVSVPDNTTVTVDADLAPAGRLKGTVLDSVSGLPLSGAKARILKASGGAAYKTFTTDANGEWESVPMPLDNYKIRYEVAGHKAQYNNNVPTTGTSGLASADVISLQTGITAAPTANMVPS